MAARPRRGTKRPRRRGRRPPTRDGLPRVLLLCEAARTEPGYFRALVRDLNLPNVAVRTPKKGQWGPRGITTAAEQQIERDSEIDEVWCVLDHDERDSEVNAFHAWLARQPSDESHSPKVRAAISIPCFEYWLLLHFTFTTKSFRGVPGGPSACEQVIRDLDSHLDHYRKADPATYDRCRDRLSTAIRHAKHGSQSERSSSTRVWELVERLQELDEMKRQTPR